MCCRVLLLLAMSAMWPALSRTLAVAQGLDPLPVEDALRSQQLGQLMPFEASADGHWLAYTSQDNQRLKPVDAQNYLRNGVPPWASGTSISIVNLETGVTRRLTDSHADSWLPAWSPNGRYLAFLSTQDGDGQARLWVWDVRDGKLRRVSDARVRGNEIEWNPDSRELFVTALPEEFSPQQYIKKIIPGAGVEKRPEAETSEPTVMVYRSEERAEGGKTPPKADAANLNLAFRDLVSVELNGGKSATIVHGARIAAYELSPDGSSVAYSIPKRFEKPGSQQILFDLAMRKIGVDETWILASEVRLDYDGRSFSWSPDGSQIGFCAGGVEEKTFDCYRIGVRAKKVVNVTQYQKPESVPRKATVPLWDSEGNIYLLHNGALWRVAAANDKAVQVAAVPGREIRQIISQPSNELWVNEADKTTVVLTYDTRGKQDGFYRIDLETGKTTALLERGQCYTCANTGKQLIVIGDGNRVAYVAEDAQHDEDLWIGDSAFHTVRQLTHLNPQFEVRKLGRARLVGWLSDDGAPLQGALLLPSDYKEGVRYPLIVWVYGGSSLSRHYNHFGLAYRGPFNMQLLATRGYAILMPDAPLHLGTPMLDLAKTVLPGVNKVIAMGIADPNRLGVMGHSFGGYSVLCLMVQTRRFKAAVTVDGAADSIAAYGQMGKDGTAFGISIEEKGQGLLGDTPWRVRDRYIENSPVFYLDRVETPILIIHGSNDTAVAPFLGDEIFVDLRRLGKEVEYAKYEGEGHSPPFWSYANQVDFCNRIIQWFNKYLNKSMGG